MLHQKQDFINALKTCFNDNSFVKLSLGNYSGNEDGLKNVYVKPVIIKKQQKLSFTYRYKTNDIVKNYTVEDSLIQFNKLIDAHGFKAGTLCTLDFDIIVTLLHNGGWKLTKQKPTHNALPNLNHDKQKNRKIEAEGKQYLKELNICDNNGVVYKNAQDKFRQINHYIEILSSLLKALPRKDVINIVDMGSGKGYLTFALYDYIVNVLQLPTKIMGVEYRKDLVNLCNIIAKKSAFNNLSFTQSSIQEYNQPNIDVLIALHACDTATDDAIYKGIIGNANLIVVAPCCHKQIRNEIEKNKANNDVDFLLKHGIFMERQAEMVTDGIRALVLEYYGYSTKVFEFISDAHTPKNVMIVGEKNKNLKTEKEDILNKIAAAKKFFGIKQHYLESLFK